VTDPLIEDLCARFRETSRIRIEEMKSLAAALERDPKDAEALQKLARHFHGLAGMGGTYGYPRVTEIGDEAEETLLPFVRLGATPSAEAIGRWGKMIRDIDEALASPGTARVVV
jgi:chemotaxis protein histidine kinase CheA